MKTVKGLMNMQHVNQLLVSTSRVVNTVKHFSPLIFRIIIREINLNTACFSSTDCLRYEVEKPHAGNRGVR